MNILLGVTSAALILPWVFIVLLPFGLVFLAAYSCYYCFRKLFYKGKRESKVGSLKLTPKHY